MLFATLELLNDMIQDNPDSLRSFALGATSTAFGVCAALFALSPDTAAQTPPPANTSTNAPTTLPDVIVTGEQTPAYKPESIAAPRMSLPLADTPQTVHVVPRQVIEDQNATTLRDVLFNVPGISFQAGEGGVPAGDQLAIRGFSARTDMFTDGVRDTGGYTRETFNIEQVEIFKGPNSAYSGRGSTGGSINNVTKTPKANRFYTSNLSYGSYDYYRGTFDFNEPLPQLSTLGMDGAAVRLNALYHDQDISGRDFIHEKRWAFNPTFAIGLGSPTRVSASYLHMEQDNKPGYGIPFVNNSNNPYGGASAVGRVAPLPFETFAGLANRDYEDLFIDVARLKLEHDFNDDQTLRNNTQFGRTYRDSVITAPRIVRNPAADPLFGPNPTVTGSDGAQYGLNHEVQSRDQTDKIFSNQTDLTSKFDTGRFDHTLVSSIEYSHETSVNYLRSGTVGTPFPFPAQTSNPLNPNPYDRFHPVNNTGARNEAAVNAGGISAFDTMKINEKFIATAGLRGDVFAANYKQFSNTGALTNDLEGVDLAATWRAGLIYKPLPNGSIYGGYGTSFNPSAEGFTLTGATETLDPEEAYSVEFGSKWEFFDRRLTLEGAIFRTDKNNYRNTDPVTGVVSVDGEVRVEGFEIGINGQITEKWNVFGGYAFMDSEIRKSSTTTTYNGVAIREQGHRLANTPEQTASLFTTYSLPYRFVIGTGVVFVDQRYSNNIETQGVPGYWLQSALLGWKANDNLSLRLNVSNLWDEDYIDRVGGGHAIPGTGRTVILTALLRF